ncbi:MAG: hypothetical protein JWM80_2595 [Cyanobacteria bacterium RYN_339]|nr:hypothetical protein [Cyanobacteria bacterium RYN_339]
MNVGGTGGLSYDGLGRVPKPLGATGPLPPTTPPGAPPAVPPTRLGTDMLRASADPLSADALEAGVPAYQPPPDPNQQAFADLVARAKAVSDPSQLAELAGAARQCQALLAADPDPDMSLLAVQAGSLADMCDHAAAATSTIDTDLAALTSSPEAAAALMLRPEALAAAVKDLGALAGTPLAAAYAAKLDELKALATPQALAARLPGLDLAALSPPARTDLAALHGADPMLDSALDQAGVALLQRGVTLEQLEADPSLGQVLAGLQGSQDPNVQPLLLDSTRSWLHASLDHACDGKQNDDGVQQAVSEHCARMQALAEATGLGPALGQSFQPVMDESAGQLHDVSMRGKGLLEQGLDVVGGLVGSLGDLVNNSFHFVGTVFEGGVHLAGQGLGAALDAAGAHDLAHDVEGAADGLGQGLGDFADGLGAGVGGMTKGLGEMVKNPVGTLQGIAALVTDGAKRDAMIGNLRDEITGHGLAYGLGYVLGNLAPMVLTGGLGEVSEVANVAAEAAELGRGASLVARAGASLADQTGLIGHLGEGLLNVAAHGDQLANLTRVLGGDVSKVSKFTGPIKDFLANHGLDFLRDAPKPEVLTDLAGQPATAAAEAAEQPAASAAGVAEKPGLQLPGPDATVRDRLAYTTDALKARYQPLAPSQLARDVRKLREMGVGELAGETKNLLGEGLTAARRGDAGAALDALKGSSLAPLLGRVPLALSVKSPIGLLRKAVNDSQLVTPGWNLLGHELLVPLAPPPDSPH